MPSAVAIDLTPSEQQRLLRDFAVPVMRRELLMVRYNDRADLASRIANYGRLMGRPSHIWVGLSSRIKRADLNGLRHEFSPATVNRLRGSDDLSSLLAGVFTQEGRHASLAQRMKEFFGTKPLLIVFEEDVKGLVEACAIGLSICDPGLISTFPIRTGTPRENWRSILRKALPGAGGLVYGEGNHLGKLNLPDLRSDPLAVWRGDDILSAMGRFYRALTTEVDLAATAPLKEHAPGV